jgi:two-component system response regulator PilR (NtrC family)
VVERSVALASGTRIEVSMLPENLREGRPATSRPGDQIGQAGDGFNLERHLQDIERSHLERALERAHGVQTRAADVLGLSFRQFRYLMKKHGLKRES